MLPLRWNQPCKVHSREVLEYITQDTIPDVKSTYPSWRRCWRSSCRSKANFGPSRTNWMASKKLLFPLPFLPTITLCFGLKGSISLWLRNDLNPDIITCLICITKSAQKKNATASSLRIELVATDTGRCQNLLGTSVREVYHRCLSMWAVRPTRLKNCFGRRQNSNIFLNLFRDCGLQSIQQSTTVLFTRFRAHPNSIQKVFFHYFDRALSLLGNSMETRLLSNRMVGG